MKKERDSYYILQPVIDVGDFIIKHKVPFIGAVVLFLVAYGDRLLQDAYYSNGELCFQVGQWIMCEPMWILPGVLILGFIFGLILNYIMRYVIWRLE